MKTNRRGFFGILGGAAVAGPSAVKSVATEIASGPSLAPPVPPVSSLYGQSVPAGDDVAWLRDEYKDIAKLLAQGPTEIPQWDREWHVVEAQRIDALRSVSPVNKARMILEYRERMRDKRNRSHLQARFDELKKRLGPLGALL